MQKENFVLGSYVHVTKRGVRGLPIVRDKEDRDRFMLMLCHFNDTYSSQNWYRDIRESDVRNSYERPAHWPKQERLVNIVAFCLLNNHFHLVLEERQENGISRFMHKLGTGMAMKFNERYDEKGALFQGPYHARTISDDRYLRYVSAYVQFKNALDMYPGGKKMPQRNFDAAFAWASRYSYSSLGDYIGVFDRPIVEKTFLKSLSTQKEYRAYCKDFYYGRCEADENIQEHITGVFE